MLKRNTAPEFLLSPTQTSSEAAKNPGKEIRKAAKKIQGRGDNPESRRGQIIKTQKCADQQL